MKSFILTATVLFTSVLNAQNPLDIFFPGYCDRMPKDPRCYQSPSGLQPSGQSMCSTQHACLTIQDVRRDQTGHFHCKATSGQIFSCNDLIRSGVTQVQGFRVHVVVPILDKCKVPGACGTSACVQTYGYATLDRSCIR